MSPTGGTPVSARSRFDQACAFTGEAMVQVINLRVAQKITAETFAELDDLYDAAVSTCREAPLTENAAEIARVKLLEFLTAASGVTGRSYGGY
jgi:hypothetical protein